MTHHNYEFQLVDRKDLKRERQEARRRIMEAAVLGNEIDSADLALLRGFTVREREDSILSDAWVLVALIIFVIGPDLKIKDSAQKIIKMADMVIVNSLKQPDNPAHILSDMISPDKSQAMVFWINLLKKHGEIDKFRANVEKMLSKKLN